MQSQKDNSVFFISMAVTAAAVLWGIISPASFDAAAKGLFGFLIKYFGWGYMLAMNIFVLFPILLCMSRFGKLRLGEPGSKPEFSNISWFAMLFSAGMGVGLVFYGVGEPVFHFMTPPFGAAAGSAKAAEDALRTTFFHWGLHPWAGYAVIALCLAYFQYRKGAPGLMSSMFLPVLGKKGNSSVLGKTIDILAIFATIAGLATSLGLGTLQINSGLKYLFDMPQNVTLQLIIIAVLAIVYTGTAVTGIERGIKFISNLNLFLACLLSMALFFIGPTMAIVESLMTGVGDYLSNVVNQSFRMAPYGGEYKGWLGGWTLYYWAWWIAWAPFVGSFIARISRGRTIREFVSGVLVVPALGSFTWFAIFGTSGLNLELTGVAKIAEKVAGDISVGVFEVYKYYPLGGVMSVIMVALISTFFITSANSGTFVLSMYSTQGDINPPKVRMGIWGILMAALAFVLLMSGGLQSLQIASIAAAAPFAVIMVVACWCLWKALVKDEATFTELAD